MQSCTSPTSNLRCGLAGWHYPHWDRIVYPSPKPRGFHALSYLSQFFGVLEINTSFYQSLRPEVSRLWVQTVASRPGFRFTAKLNRRFTHDRVLDPGEVKAFRDGLEPMSQAGVLGCLLMQFPWSFRFTAENREYFIQLRRAFRGYPLVAELRHDSWSCEEALGTFIDYHVGFANMDQPEYIHAMPPTAFLTSAIGYVRLHGRNGGKPLTEQRANYLYSPGELAEWKKRIEKLRTFAAETYVIANNDLGGKSVVNALQLQTMLLGQKHVAPQGIQNKYTHELHDYVERPKQERLFELPAPAPIRRAVA